MPLSNDRLITIPTGRDIITLDLDNIPAGGTDDVLRRVEGLGVGYCVYSTGSTTKYMNMKKGQQDDLKDVGG